MQPLGVVANVALDRPDVDGVVQAALTGRGAAGPADLADLAVTERLVALTTRHLRLHVRAHRVARSTVRGRARRGRRTTTGRSPRPCPGGIAGGAASTAARRRTR